MRKSALLTAASTLVLFGLAGCEQGAEEIAIDADDIAGVVTGPNGPEAGVWVIAETDDLPTVYTKIVVTDDAGRYVLPDLPDATYSVWVRGYGLVDSAKVDATPGAQLALTATPAPDAAAAAHYYPALYWWAMLDIPAAGEFPGTGEAGNGIAEEMQTQAHWVGMMKDRCYSCHQLGNEMTRLVPPALGEFETTLDAWTRRIQSGQASANMVNNIGRFGAQRALRHFADWTDAINAGALPADAPPRPTGQERNVVLTLWDWASPTTYLHDEISVDRRDPTLNPNGPIFGSPENSTDFLPILDPVTHTTSELRVPVLDPATPSTVDDPMFADSPYFGAERIWDSQTVVHNPMYDHLNRMWVTARIRDTDNPAFCKEGSDHPSAQLFPLNGSPRQAAVYDPSTEEWSLIDTCFGTHHLVFADDADDTLYFSVGFPNGGPVIGWLNTRQWEETGDAQAAINWSPFILDTNGNGQRDEGYTQPNEPIDPARDARINAFPYATVPSLADGSLWGAHIGVPGGIVRMVLGDNAPASAMAEYFEVPMDAGGVMPRGLDVDKNGVVWVSLQSGHLGSFDRSKCTGPMNGPEATGRHCPEGWTLYPLPGPNFETVTTGGSADSPYYAWVDQFNTFGLGEDVPIAMGNASDALHALVNGEWVTLRVPYPMGFFAKNADGRIDDPDGGWKGRGLWSTFGNRTPFHHETGVGSRPKAVKFQLRPDPLAH